MTEKYLIGITRSSSQEVADGYGPSIQKSELTLDASKLGYQLRDIRDIVEPATINLEDRELFNEILNEAYALKKGNLCDGVIFSRCDRLSRRFDTAMQIALDCKKHGLAIRFVRENQWLHPDDDSIQFIMFMLNAYGVDTQTKISVSNMKAGRYRAAAEGKLPAGVGSGMLGYTLKNKAFETNSFIVVTDEILKRALEGDSINRITRDLQIRGVTASTGKPVTRNTVANVLRHAKRYAGIWAWGGHEIRDLIPARITEEQADIILDNLKRNRERSYGYGKRKWLTSRVICGVCGRSYVLRKKGCACSRSDSYKAYPPCSSPKMSWNRFSHHVWDTFVQCLLGLDSLELMIDDKRQAWETYKENTDKQRTRLEEQLTKLQQKRRHYSWQQAEGIITDDELVQAHKHIRSEETTINDQLGRIDEYGDCVIPPDKEAFKQLAEYWRGDLVCELDQVSDEVKSKFAEFFDLYVTVHPNDGQQGYSISLTANIPLEMEGDASNAYDMVLSSSGK